MATRDEAWELVCEWTESDSLRKHMLAVEAAVRAYARRTGEDEETWAVAALVHDLDYERYPDAESGHPRKAVEELRSRASQADAVERHIRAKVHPPPLRRRLRPSCMRTSVRT